MASNGRCECRKGGIVIEQPDGSVALGYDWEDLLKKTSLHETQQVVSLQLEHQQQGTARENLLKYRVGIARGVFLLILGTDFAFIIFTIIWDVFQRPPEDRYYNEHHQKFQPPRTWLHWWLDSEAIRLEDLILGLAANIIGLVGSFQVLPRILVVFAIVKAITTGLIIVSTGISLFVVYRLALISAALVQRHFALELLNELEIHGRLTRPRQAYFSTLTSRLNTWLASRSSLPGSQHRQPVDIQAVPGISRDSENHSTASTNVVDPARLFVMTIPVDVESTTADEAAYHCGYCGNGETSHLADTPCRCPCCTPSTSGATHQDGARTFSRPRTTACCGVDTSSSYGYGPSRAIGTDAPACSCCATTSGTSPGPVEAPVLR